MGLHNQIRIQNGAGTKRHWRPDQKERRIALQEVRYFRFFVQVDKKYKEHAIDARHFRVSLLGFNEYWESVRTLNNKRNETCVIMESNTVEEENNRFNRITIKGNIKS
jgi:hypothetical protein